MLQCLVFTQMGELWKGINRPNHFSLYPIWITVMGTYLHTHKWYTLSHKNGQNGRSIKMEFICNLNSKKIDEVHLYLQHVRENIANINKENINNISA